MKVTVEDDRVFPEYKNVHIMALVRNVLNANGLDWSSCEAIGKYIQEAIEDADYLCDDVGRTWARSFTPGDKHDG